MVSDGGTSHTQITINGLHGHVDGECVGASGATKDKRFKIISIAPDVCLTPKKPGYPIPYPITHKLDQSMNCSPNVFLQDNAVYLHNESYVDNVKGDEPGKGGGVVSQVNVKISHDIDHSKSVFVNGKEIVRTADKIWMNWKTP